ncbi:MAG TPA: alpha/beta fold hydrolase [Candidatus Deferrimicrobium sp.]|nr:alpha/beta fold hydrolase [Candidatus Deferrimicrobium sp.]
MVARWKRRTVALGWGRLSVYVAGTGPPLLLLHGLGGSGRYWAGSAPLLAQTRTLIAPDLPGFGRSDKPRLDYTRNFHVESIEAMLSALSVDGRVDIAGHSMGGILAALVGARNPERVASLAVVASPFPRRQLHPHRMPHGHLSRSVYRTVQRLLPLVSPLVRSPVFPREVVADYLRHTVASYQGTSKALIWDPSVADEFATLDDALRGRPQLLLFSGEDTTIGGDNLDRWRAVLPRAEVLVMPGAHQLLLRDHFATLARWYGAAVALAAAEPIRH